KGFTVFFIGVKAGQNRSIFGATQPNECLVSAQSLYRILKTSRRQAGNEAIHWDLNQSGSCLYQDNRRVPQQAKDLRLGYDACEKRRVGFLVTSRKIKLARWGHELNGHWQGAADGADQSRCPVRSIEQF